MPRGPNTSWKEVSMLIRGAAIVLIWDCLIIKLNKLLQPRLVVVCVVQSDWELYCGLDFKKIRAGNFYILSS